jgi:hypothetical protein
MYDLETKKIIESFFFERFLRIYKPKLQTHEENFYITVFTHRFNQEAKRNLSCKNQAGN